MNINAYSSGFNALNAVSLYQNSVYREEEDSSEHLFDLNRQPSSNSMEFDEEREFVVVKLEKEDGPGSSMAIDREDDFAEVKTEPDLESPKKLLSVNKEIKTRIKDINPSYNPKKEIGVENCLPCTISFYNWIQSGSAYPEEVDPHAKPLYEHMFPANGSYYLLLDPFLEKLQNPKTILELDENGNSTEYICLTEDRPLTFNSVPLIGLKDRVQNEIPWKQYENSTETFKLGILFLNFREDDSKAHFLNFLYCKTASRKKGEVDSFKLYIIDPQSKEIFTFEKFLKDYQYSYADDIKIWSGQNQINFNCNKTVNEMARSFKTEEPEDQNPFVEYLHTDDVVRSVDSVARKNTLKIKLNRSIEGDLQPEISKKSKRNPSLPLKLTVQQGNLSKSSSDYSSDGSTDFESQKLDGKKIRINFKRSREEDFESEITKKSKQNNVARSTMTDLGPELPINNPWTKIGQMQSFNKENSWKMLDQYEDLDQAFLLDNEVIEMPVHKPYKIDLTKKESSKDSTESLSENFIGDDVEIIINTNSTPVDNAKNLTFGGGSAEFHYEEALKYYYGNGVELDLKAAFKHYKIAADKGHKIAQNSMGFMYSTGQGVELDLIAAFNYYKLASDNGYAPAKYSLAHLYLNGLGVAQNFKKAFEYYTLAEVKGLAIGQYGVGNMYYKGQGRTQNYTLALKFFRRAAAQNHAEAQYECGIIYLNGLGSVVKNIQKAFKFLALAVKQNHTGAIYELGKIYLEGNGCDQNLEKALKYITLAAERKDSSAQCTLGKMYLSGQGVGKDLVKSIECFKLAIAQKNSVAECILGKMYLKGEEVELDIQEGLRLINLAADHGSATAQFILGKMYSKGKVVEQDFSKSIKYLNLASEQGHTKAAYKLGCIYFKGEEDVPQSNQVALTFFEKAANRGHADAQGIAGRLNYENKSMSSAAKFSAMGAKQGNVMAQTILGRIRLEQGNWFNEGNYAEALKYSLLGVEQGEPIAYGTLGNMYLHSMGVEQDLEKALNYSQLGAAQNDALAQCNLGQMYYKGLGVQQNFKEAFKYAKLSADQGNKNAQNNVGSAYLKGDGIEQNYVEAIKYLKLSSKQDVIAASYELGVIYLKGNSVIPKDIQKASKYFTKAAQKGHHEAQGMCGRISFENYDTITNISYSKIVLNSALNYSKNAADRGNAMGQGTLGMMHLEGKGVPQNIEEGLKYIILAVAQGDSGAQRTLGILLIEGKVVPKNIEEGLNNLKLAGDQDDAAALYTLGEIYSSGEIVQADSNESIKYYKLAIAHGCKKSKAMLDRIDSYFV